MKKSIYRAIVLGEILFDVFQNDRHLGGAPFNFAYHLLNLGVPTALISRVGDDELGRKIIAISEDLGFPTGGIQIDSDKPTGEARVLPQPFGGPRFEILTDCAYDYIKEDAFLNSQKTSELAYFGTLAQRSETSRHTIIKFLQSQKGKMTIFLDLNLRPPFYDYGIIDASLSLCDIMKVNEEELKVVQSLLGLNYYFGIGPLIDHLHREYDIRWICVTRGEQGCELFERGNSVSLKQSAVPVEKFKDSVGAGDAFSAILALGIMNKLDMKVTLESASFFASKICTIKGALPSTPDLYRSFFLSDA
tara:strand:- start:1029 stop:1943 length:915 start_codon:yes stop_codon:yes gene_type:complete